VLFITGYDANAVLDDDPLPQGMRVLTKPFDLEKLVDQVNILLRD